MVEIVPLLWTEVTGVDGKRASRPWIWLVTMPNGRRALYLDVGEGMGYPGVRLTIEGAAPEPPASTDGRRKAWLRWCSFFSGGGKG